MLFMLTGELGTIIYFVQPLFFHYHCSPFRVHAEIWNIGYSYIFLFVGSFIHLV